MIYLCSVYSLNPDGRDKEAMNKLMEKRWKYVMKRTSEFLKEGVILFSPIAHCHELALRHGMPKTFSFWEHLDFGYIEASSHVWVLMMPGWQDSVGVSAEIKEAHRTGKTVRFIRCKDYYEDAKADRQFLRSNSNEHK